MKMISATSRLTKYQPPNRQNGAALVVGLLILLVLTMIGINGMQGTLFEQKMAANTRDRNLAFQNAESALREAEMMVGGLVSLGNFDGTAGLFGLSDPEPDYSLTPTWDDPANNVVSSDYYGSYRAPRYIIKRFTTVTGMEGALNMSGYGDNKGSGDITIFKITARGTGGSAESAEVILRSHYGRIF